MGLFLSVANHGDSNKEREKQMIDIQDKIQSILTACGKMQNLTPSEIARLGSSEQKEIEFQLASADTAVWKAVEIVEEIQP